MKTSLVHDVAQMLGRPTDEYQMMRRNWEAALVENNINVYATWITKEASQINAE